MTEPRTDTRTLGYAMLLLSRKLQDATDSANAHEAAERLVEQLREIALLKEEIERLKARGSDDADDPVIDQVIPDRTFCMDGRNPCYSWREKESDK